MIYIILYPLRNRNVAYARTTKKMIKCTGSNWVVNYCAYINGVRDKEKSKGLDSARRYLQDGPRAVT